MFAINSIWPVVNEFLDNLHLWEKEITDGAVAQRHEDDDNIVVWRADTILFPNGKYGVVIATADIPGAASPLSAWYMIASKNYTRYKDPFTLGNVIMSMIASYKDEILTETDATTLRGYVTTFGKHEAFFRSRNHDETNHILSVWAIDKYLEGSTDEKTIRV